MGFLSDLWDFIKSTARSIYKCFSKLFSVFFKGVEFFVECIIGKIIEVKNSWFGTLIEGASFMFDIIEFLESKGAKVDKESYRRQLSDMDNINERRAHRCQIIIY